MSELPDLAVEVDFTQDDTWTDLIDYVREGSINRGVSLFDGVYARAEAGTSKVELNNNDARFDPSYLDGPYVDDAVDSYVALNGTTFTNIDTPDSASLSITGDIDIRLKLRREDWSSQGVLCAKWDDDQNNSDWNFWTLVSGSETLLNFDWTESGGVPVSSVTSNASIAITDGTTKWVRVTLDVNNGAGGRDISFYTSDDGSSWTQLGTTITQAGTTSIQNGTANVHIGDSNGSAADRKVADIYQFELRNGINGTVVASPDFSNKTTSFTSVTDAQGNVWTLRGQAIGIIMEPKKTQLKPRREARIRATYNSVTYDLWRGFVEQWKPRYAVNGLASITTLMGVDGTSVFSNYNGDEVSPVGSGETTGARIGRIADLVSWPALLRDIDTGLTTVQSTTLADNAWGMVLLTSDTEIGEVYFSGAGKLVFRDRHALLSETRSRVSQATFSDDGVGLGYTSLDVTYDGLQIFNQISIARAGGTAQTAQDTESQSIFYPKTFTRHDLIHETDSESLDYANYILGLFKHGELRFDSMTINPLSDPDNLFPQVLGRELGDRISIEFHPPGRTDSIERDCYIRGIEHVFTSDTWTTRWVLQDASRFNFLIFDDSANGQFDGARFGY